MRPHLQRPHCLITDSLWKSAFRVWLEQREHEKLAEFHQKLTQLMANKTDMGPNQLVFIINIDALLCQGIIWTTWWYNTPLYCVSVSLSSIETSAEVYLGHAMNAGPCWSVIQPNNLSFATLGAQTHCCFANGGDKTRALSNTWVKFGVLIIIFYEFMWKWNEKYFLSKMLSINKWLVRAGTGIGLPFFLEKLPTFAFELRK